MARTRGHVIVKNEDKWVKFYLAYNGNPDWMLPMLAKYPSDIASKVHCCRTGICQIDEHHSNVYVGEYHDFKQLDLCAHPNQEFTSLEEALASCVLENIYVWDGVSWSHRTLEAVVSPERLSEIRPLKRKKNVWRDMRKAHEAKTAEDEDVGIKSLLVDLEVQTDGAEESQPE